MDGRQVIERLNGHQTRCASSSLCVTATATTHTRIHVRGHGSKAKRVVSLHNGLTFGPCRLVVKSSRCGREAGCSTHPRDIVCLNCGFFPSLFPFLSPPLSHGSCSIIVRLLCADLVVSYILSGYRTQRATILAARSLSFQVTIRRHRFIRFRSTLHPSSSFVVPPSIQQISAPLSRRSTVWQT